MSIFTRATRSIAQYMLRQRGWLGVWLQWLGIWLAVCHSQYCVKTTKPILFSTIW